VRFSNINNKELDSIGETAMERREVPSLGTKRRSGVAAENQGYRLSPAKGAELHFFGTAEARQLEVGGRPRFRRESLAFRERLHLRGAPFGLHPGGELHHPIEILFG
jgi:hypothetical protein